MKYIKTYESDGTFKIGDHVTTFDYFSIDAGEEPAIWHNRYGIIKDISMPYGSDKSLVYLIRFLSELDKDFIEFISRYDHSHIKSSIGYKKKKSELWFCGEYLIKYKTKKDYDDAVEKIEVTKSINKYNI